MALETIPARDQLTTREGYVTPRWSQWFLTLTKIVSRLDSGVRPGTGSPEGVVAAPGGTLYQRGDGPPWVYVKESDGTLTTGWRAL